MKNNSAYMLQREAWIVLLIALPITLVISGDVNGSELPHILRSKARTNRMHAMVGLSYSKILFVGKGTQKRLCSPEWIKHESDPWFWFKGLYMLTVSFDHGKYERIL